MNRRTIIVALIAIGQLFPGVVFAAYDVTQIPGQVLDTGQTIGNTFTGVTGVRLTDVLEAAGLQGADKKACLAGSILGQLDNILGNFKDILLNELSGLLKTGLQSISRSLVQCSVGQLLQGASSIASKVPGVGSVVGGILGGASGSFPQCVIQLSGADFSAAVQQHLQDWKQNFIGRCVAAATLQNMFAYTDQLLAEQGPNGGPAAVSNWVTDLYTEPDRQAVRRMWTILVNTPICPSFRDAALDYFDVPQSYRDDPPTITAVDLNTSANMPFQLRAACTLPTDVDTSNLNDPAAFVAAGGFDFLDLANQSQNNFNGFIDMAETEMQRQRAVAVQAAVNEAVAGGGYRSIYGPAGTACAVMDPDGKCIQPANARQAPITAADLKNNEFQAMYNWAISTNGTTNKAITDIESQFVNHLLDMANQPLPFNIEFGFEDQPKNFTPAPTSSVIPGSGAANDPACTDGNPACTCVENEQAIQNAIASVLKIAIANTQSADPDLFDPSGSNHIAAGVDYRTVLTAICDQVQGSGTQTCKPHPTSNTMIVLISPALSLSVDVITGTGDLRTNGGQVIAACEAGVLD